MFAHSVIYNNCYFSLFSIKGCPRCPGQSTGGSNIYSNCTQIVYNPERTQDCCCQRWQNCGTWNALRTYSPQRVLLQTQSSAATKSLNTQRLNCILENTTMYYYFILLKLTHHSILESRDILFLIQRLFITFLCLFHTFKRDYLQS